jgi:NAD-dependent dihydropyrimidine dehydrogenase PreA subunit
VTYVITSSCVDIKDMSCIEECPVDCIYEGDRKLYIQPKECIDCGACEPVCPVDAIYADRTLPAELAEDQQDNHAFFYETLPERSAPLSSPGGSRRTGPVEADTPRTVELPPNPAALDRL